MGIEEDVGYIKAKLEDIVDALDDIKSGSMAICQLHADSLQRMQNQIDGKTSGDEKKVAGLSIGKWKLIGTPAIIVSVFLGIAILQYVHTMNVAETVKEEVKTEAVAVAKNETLRENRAIERDEVATVIREELAQAVEKFIKENKK